MENMTKAVYEAAKEGSVTSLLTLLQIDELILERCMVTSYGDTPLHISAMLGHVEFCVELLRQIPGLARELDSRRSCALHLASAKGYVEIVKVLLSANPEMCNARDRDGNNPVHVAAMKGKVEVLKEMVKVNPNAALARVDRGETILHLCVQYSQLEALKLLVEHLNDEELLNATDDLGDTILHLAVADKQIEMIRYLAKNTAIDVNAQNSQGLTALEKLARSRRDTRDLDISDCLRQTAEQKSEEISSPAPKLSLSSSTHQPAADATSSSKPGKHHVNQKGESFLLEQRNTIIVVASLMATVGFQAVVNPPGGFWQDNEKGHIAGTSIFAHQEPYMYTRFAIETSISFIGSLTTILILVDGYPFKHSLYWWITTFIIGVSLTSTVSAYSYALMASAPIKDAGSGRWHIADLTTSGWFLLISILFLENIFSGIKRICRCFMQRRRRPRSSSNNPSTTITV